MLQVKSFTLKSIAELDNTVNTFLKTIPEENIKSISIKEESGFVLIQYSIAEEWKKALCCDCQYWDDNGDVESTSGLCQECGMRKRFNCKACAKFKDVRG